MVSRPARGQKEALILVEILIIFALTLLNGVFSAAEIAVVSLRASRVEQLVEGGGRRARAVKALRADPERFLATVQIGITVVGAIAGVFGGATIAEHLRPLFEGIPLLARHAGSIALAIVVVLVSYLSLVVGELIPKSLALRFAEGYALLISRPLMGLSWLARPIVWFLTASSNVILRFFGDKTNFTEARLSPDELQHLVGEATKQGAVGESVGEIASRAIDFADLTVGEVMVQRRSVKAIANAAPMDELRRLVRETGHTRVPVYEGDVDNVVGYVNVKDVVARDGDHPVRRLEEILRPAYFIAETMSATALLDEMKRRRTQIAIVVDELGAMRGLVTLEDLVEELVGEIASEHDKPAPEMIRAQPDGSFVVLGTTPVREVNRALDLDLPIGEAWSTLAGLCLDLAGRIPSVGEKLEAPDGTALEIVEASQRHVRAVRLRKKPEEPAIEGAAAPPPEEG